MGGLAKGLLEAPSGERIVQRWRRIFDAACIPCVLVGDAVSYDAFELEAIADARGEPEASLGPIGGLIALLARAPESEVIAVACDMPYVSAELVERLASAPAAPAVAARRGGRWEPFFARYDARAALEPARALARGRRTSLQALLDALGAVELPLSQEEERELRDWDSPEDVERR